jgi:putative DNA primase/helicase
MNAHVHPEHVDFAAVKAASLRSLNFIIPSLLLGGKRVGDEWVARNPTRNDAKPGSFSVNMKTGVWSDFATGESGGDMIDLYVYLKGGSNIQAKDALADMLNVKPSAGSTSLTGNIPTGPQPKRPKGAATPASAGSAPKDFPPRTPPDDKGKPTFIRAGDEGPRANGNEKRRHVYCQGGAPVRIKIIKKDKKGATNAYRVADSDDATGWQFAKPEGYEEVPYFVGPNPFDTDRVIFWPEGEKDAQLVNELGGLAITFGGTGDGLPNGCEQYVADRNVVILADNDEPGREHAEKKAALASRVAASVKVVHFPELDDHQDVSDWIAGGKTFDDLKSRVMAAELWQPVERENSKNEEPKADEPEAAKAENSLPHGYSFTIRGLMYHSNKPEEPPTYVAGCFDIVAETRDGDGSNWGLLLHWQDNDGRDHRVPLAREMLAGDGGDARRMLMKQGLSIGASQKARMLFNAFLLEVKSPNRARATEHIGWHDGAYVLPDASYGGDPHETLLLQSPTAHEHSFRQSGSLEDWQQAIARYAVGNSRLAFMMSAAFAGVLIEPCSAEGGGFHVIGSSSTGKTTGLRVAASVWGDPSYMKTWRATSNGLEGIAKNHCDGLLCLDEIAQINARDAGEAAYMLANGQGKARSKTDGEARKLAQWRILFLSTGEISLASKVAEDGTRRKTTAGQQVRVVDIPADAGAGMGMFENLHGFPSGKALSVHLCSTVKRQHGTAGRAFLAAIVPQIDEIRKDAPIMMQNFCNEFVPAGADGQVMRVAQRFALVAVAGELAQAFGILPWEPGEAVKAAGKCFKDWLRERGGIGDAETTGGIEQVRAFLQADGMARFIPAWEQEEQEKGSKQSPHMSQRAPIPQRDVAGFRRKTNNGWEFFIATTAWKEVCAGFNPTMLAKTLRDRGWLLPDTDGKHIQKSVSVPGHGQGRYYQITAQFLGDGDHDQVI